MNSAIFVNKKVLECKETQNSVGCTYSDAMETEVLEHHFSLCPSEQDLPEWA
jgi:hypothetical protein